MSYVKVVDLLKNADQQKTAVIAFICIDYNMVASVIRAAEEQRKPAIIMLLPEHVSLNKMPGFEEFAAMVKEMAQKASIPVALHLDHSFDEEEVYRAIDAGFSSVMFDASRDDLEENIRRTKAVVDYAHARSVSVEAELGSVGLAIDRADKNTDFYTKPSTVKVYCESTGVDSLAIAIGNAHGDYPLPPKLDLNRLDEINAITDVPLVLHGGSGIPEDQLTEAFARGINKFNYGTDLLRCYQDAIRRYFTEHAPSAALDIIGLPEYVQDEMVKLVLHKLTLEKYRL